MDQFIYWLDNSNLFAPIGHTWPWGIVTATVAIGALVGIANIARHYGHPHDGMTD